MWTTKHRSRNGLRCFTVKPLMVIFQVMLKGKWHDDQPWEFEIWYFLAPRGPERMMLEATKNGQFHPKMDGIVWENQTWMLLSNTHLGLLAKEDAKKDMMLTTKMEFIAMTEIGWDWSGQLSSLHVSKHQHLATGSRNLASFSRSFRYRMVHICTV